MTGQDARLTGAIAHNHGFAFEVRYSHFVMAAVAGPTGAPIAVLNSNCLDTYSATDGEGCIGVA